MLRYEDNCVGCPPERGCMGDSCPNRNVPIWSCDECGDEGVDIYEFDTDAHLCERCLLGKFKLLNRRW